MREDEWLVPDLLDNEQPFIEDVNLARQIVETLDKINKTEIDVRVPKAAIEFAERTLSEWFEVIADIEKKRGNLPYLVDRSLYSAMYDSEVLEWNQGLRRDDFETWLEDNDLMERFDQTFPRIKINDLAKSEQPLSGYYNRILPIKLTLRVMAAMAFAESHENEDWSDADISLKSLRENSLNVAKYTREWLTYLDARSGSTKGSEISVGFPDKTEKAAERFVAQFVGSKRNKKLSGAIFEMGFANISEFMGTLLDDLRFTNPGWQFAMMRNPIIDGGMEGWKEYIESGRRFSDDEIKFLIMHFKQNVPAEWKLIETISNLIESGSNRPQALQEKLVEQYDWDKTKASQMRNGALSRMEELCLISRTKQGREVTYSLTDLCNQIILEKK